MTFTGTNAQGLFLNSELYLNNEPDQQIYQLKQFAFDTANSVNSREISLYPSVEILTGKQLFESATTRKFFNVFRKCFKVGAVAAGATLVTAHGITGITQFFDYWGIATTNVVDWRKMPYASVTANANIELNVDVTNFTINNGAAGPNITSALIFLEYSKE